MNKIIKATDFHKHLKENLKDSKFKEAFDEHGKQLEIASALGKDLKISFAK